MKFAQHISELKSDPSYSRFFKKCLKKPESEMLDPSQYLDRNILFTVLLAQLDKYIFQISLYYSKVYRAWNRFTYLIIKLVFKILIHNMKK
jgi:hypothetical protein